MRRDEATRAGAGDRPAVGSRERGGALAEVLRFARTATWLLGLNCLQNLVLAPRAVRGDSGGRERTAPPPRVSILLPVRDEAANVEDCLRGLLTQRHPVTEILVLDDGSTDGTAAIARRLAAEAGDERLRILPGHERQPGWTGKNWACQQLADTATGDWLLFIDADTRLKPECVGATMALAREYAADLVSLLPRQVAVTLGERLIVPQLPLIIDALLPLALVPRRARWATAFAGAYGPFLCFRRAWYKGLGGHAAVRGLLGEDIQFAVATKRRGGRLVLADGGAVLTCRLYRGFADAWRGMARNAFPGALGSPRLFWPFVAAWAALFALPPLTLLGLALGRLIGFACLGGPQVRLALGATAGQIALRYLSGRRHAQPPWDAALQPISSLLTLGILLDSYRRHRTGAVTWRGRPFR